MRVPERLLNGSAIKQALPQVHLVFNNNHGHSGTTNALELTEMVAGTVSGLPT